MIIFFTNMIYFFMFIVPQIWKIKLCQTVILHGNLESAEFTNKKHGKPTLHSLIANHVLEISVKLEFQCVRFEKKHCFALVFWIGFLFVFVTACSHDATCIIRFFCIIMLKPKKWFMNQWTKRSCALAKRKLFQPSAYHHIYRFCKRWPVFKVSHKW